MPRNLKTTQLERGQSLTELALTMTLMLVLLAGVADIGRAFFTYIALRDSAQEGALYGSFAFAEIDPMPPGGLYSQSTVCNMIKNRVMDHSNNPVNLATDANISVEVAAAATPDTWVDCQAYTPRPCIYDKLRVTVSYKNFTLATPFLGTLVGSQTVKISASVKDTILTPTHYVYASCPY